MKTDYIIHDTALNGIKTLADNSINCVITSPPYWQLRDYGFSEQWGLELTYQKYLEHLWSLMDEMWRVLKDDGSVWINLGDTYGTTSGNMRNTIKSKESDHTGESIHINQPKTIHKCQLLIPHRFAIGCIDRGWIVRNDIIWAKRNGMPESVTDRFSKKHEYIFLMVKSKKYYFDLDGIRDKNKQASIERSLRGNSETNKYVEGDHLPNGVHANTMSQPRPNRTKIAKENCEMYGSPRARNHRDTGYNEILNELGKNPGDVSDFWDIPTQPSSKEHYATFNSKLIDKSIIAGCPENGIILDPFCGTGTTLIRSKQLMRNVIGIDGSKEYCEIADKELNKELAQGRLF